MDFRYRLMQFMTGRYGVDKLFYVIFGLSVALSVVNIFVRSVVLQIIIYALMIFAIYRMFSRNTVRRRAENEKLLGLSGFIRRKKELSLKKKNDKCHIYKKCPYCRAILRLPRRPGLHSTICPKCGKEFSVKVRK